MTNLHPTFDAILSGAKRAQVLMAPGAHRVEYGLRGSTTRSWASYRSAEAARRAFEKAATELRPQTFVELFIDGRGADLVVNYEPRSPRDHLREAGRTFNVYRWHAETHEAVFLGKWNATTMPGAVIAAYRDLKIMTNEEQRRIFSRPADRDEYAQ